MGKKHKHPEHENLERWLVSYADFITLLFATFVVLYALSLADLAKFKEVSKAIRTAFNPAKAALENPGGVLKGDPEAKILKNTGNSILDKIIPKVPDTISMEGSIKPVAESVKSINKDIKRANADSSETSGTASLKIQERGIVISFSSSFFFQPGEAGIKPQAFGVLDKMAKTLKNSGRIIHVEGHTDSQPISTAIYPSNWELSTARASSVVRYFINKHHFDPQAMAAVGYGDSRPVASNVTEEGRTKNRRVDIVILFSSAAADADAGIAQGGEKVVIRSGEGEGIQNNETTHITPEASQKTAKPINIRPKSVDVLDDNNKMFEKQRESYPDFDSSKKVKVFKKSELRNDNPNNSVADEL